MVLAFLFYPSLLSGQDITESEKEEFQQIREKLERRGYIRQLEERSAFDLATVEAKIVEASYTGKSFPVATTDSRSSDFSPDGIRFYILGRSSRNIIEYELTIPWDIESAALKRELDISTEMGSGEQMFAVPHGLYLRKDDGIMMWVFNRTEIWEYTLSIPWNISTATPTGYKDLSEYVARSHDIDFKPDGTVLYIDDRINGSVYQFNLTTPWDIETAELDLVLDISAQQEAVRGIQLNGEGNRMYLMDTARRDVLEYYLTTPFDISTASYAGFFSVAGETTNPRGITFKSDFSAFYVTATESNTIYQYHLPQPEFFVSYSNGWNLAGIPVETTGFPYHQLFEKITQEPYKFESNSYSTSENLIPSSGYWILLGEEETVGFEGELLDFVVLDLNQGWNLVSGIGHSLPETAVEDAEGIITSAWYGFSGAYFTATDIEPGYGYWVRASEAGTVTLEHSAAKMLAAKQSEQPLQRFNPQEEFYSLHFISGRDTLQTLWFGGELPEEILPARFVMPPLPPAEAFDARFAGIESRLAEGAAPQIAMQSGEREIEIHLQTPGMVPIQSWEVVQMTGDGKPVDRQALSDGEAVALHPAGVTHIELVPLDSRFAEGSLDLPNQFALEQNYPNPFNPTTQIRYQLPTASDVRLDVYDMTGRHVATLVNGQVSAGSHSVTFDASNLSSGVYMYRLQARRSLGEGGQAGQYQQVKRLTVIK